MPQIYFSDTAKKELNNKNMDEINLINKTVEKLRDNLWRNGTRVKKLQGAAKNKGIYEARLNKSNRILFSVCRSNEILIYNADVKHDDVDRKARNIDMYIHSISLDDHAAVKMARSILGEDYNFNVYAEAKQENLNIHQIIDFQNNNWSEQEEINSYVKNSKFYYLTDEDWIRFFNKDHHSKEDMLDFKLKLTQEQKNAMKEKNPLFIAGTAGSGKTTILIYKLACEPKEEKIYLTYSKKLCNEAQSLFKNLVRGEPEYDEYIKNTKFITFEEFYKTILDNETITEMDRERFMNEYKTFARDAKIKKNFPPMMIWEEIRSIWKSGLYSDDGEDLSLQRYLSISSDRAPNFADKREGAYKIYERYKDYLEKHCIFDEMDIIKKVIPVVKNKGINYKIVACDEVQDITNMHIDLILELAQYRANRIILAGDDHQVIHYSGFRWENINDEFYRKLNIRLKRVILNKNFRNVGNIVNLANSVNKVQERFTDFHYEKTIDQIKKFGEVPRLCNGLKESDILKVLLKAGPSQAILVRNEEMESNLKNKFKEKFGKYPIIFTISEAKGLEFDSVVLWKIIESDSEQYNEWERILRKMGLQLTKISNKDDLDNKIQRFIRYEVSMIYVAITRGMKNCIIYEGNKISNFWNIDEITSKIKFEDKIYEIDKFYSFNYTSADWFNQALYLFDKKAYKQAIECLERVEDSKLKCKVNKLKAECMAYFNIENGQLRSAAELFINIGQIDNAAKCYDEAGMFLEASKLYEFNTYECKDVSKYNEYSIKYWDSKLDWYKSGLFCMQKKRFEDAGKRFEKVERWKFAKNAYIKAGDLESANRVDKKWRQ